MQQILKTSDLIAKKNIINRISGVPGGVSLAVTNLVAGSVIPEGIPISAPSSGVRTICKQAQLLTGSTTTALVVATQANQFKVGDGIMQAVDGASYDVDTVEDEGDGTTTVTVGTALESATVGTWIYESSGAEGARTGALENAPDVILKAAFVVPSTTQVILIKDALVRADVHENVIGPLNLATLDVNVIKY